MEKQWVNSEEKNQKKKEKNTSRWWYFQEKLKKNSFNMLCFVLWVNYTDIVKIKNIKKYKTEGKNRWKQQYRKITIIVLIHILGNNYLCFFFFFFGGGVAFCFSSPYLICMVQILIPDIRKWPHLLCKWRKRKDRNSLSHTLLILSLYTLALDRKLMNWKSFLMGLMLFVVSTKSVSHSGTRFSCMDLHY